MKEQLKILIIEDEALITDHLAITLESIGYYIVDIVDTANEAFKVLEYKKVDFAIIDIKIIGDLSGIDIAKKINNKYKIPFIYLTSNTDATTLNEVKETNPYGFLVKPFSEKDLMPSIEIALHKHKLNNYNKNLEKKYNSSIFIKEKHMLIKILCSEILYIEAHDNYSFIYLKNKKFLISKTLKYLQENLPDEFLRVHRSYVINLNYIDCILPSYLLINNIEIPISKTGKKHLNEYINTL